MTRSETKPEAEVVDFCEMFHRGQLFLHGDLGHDNATLEKDVKNNLGVQSVKGETGATQQKHEQHLLNKCQKAKKKHKPRRF